MFRSAREVITTCGAPTRYREVVLTVSKYDVHCWAQSVPPRGSGWVSRGHLRSRLDTVSTTPR